MRRHLEVITHFLLDLILIILQNVTAHSSLCLCAVFELTPSVRFTYPNLLLVHQPSKQMICVLAWMVPVDFTHTRS